MGRVKRIILTVTNDLTYDQRMQKICTSLSNGGYEVELVGRERDFSIPFKNQPFKQTRLKCFFNKGKLFYFEYNLRLLLYLAFSKFDAVCAIDLDTIAPIYITGKLKGAKLIYDAHEYFTEVPEVVRRPSVQKVWKWVEKTFLPRFDLVYTVSESLAQLFQKEYRKEVHVILNAPPLNRDIQNTSSEHDRYILYQGALNESRGLEQLIEAMPNINCKLKLAGEGDLSQKLRDLTKSLNLQHKVEFLGYIEPPQLKQITAAAAIGISISENNGLSYYYGLSNKFFDYIHCLVPQIASDYPEFRKQNDKYHVAVLINDCNSAEIKAAIERLLSDKALYLQLQNNCKTCREEMNWQQEEKKLLSWYGHLFR